MKRINFDTVVGYDRLGNDIQAERLSKWAYKQLKTAPDLLEACKKLVEEIGIDGRLPGLIDGWEMAQKAIAEAESEE